MIQPLFSRLTLNANTLELLQDFNQINWFYGLSSVDFAVVFVLVDRSHFFQDYLNASRAICPCSWKKLERMLIDPMHSLRADNITKQYKTQQTNSLSANEVTM